MEVADKILFWFREPDLLDGDENLWPSVTNCDEFIPVFCFDPRETQVEPSVRFHINTAEKVQHLRHKLQKRGSNLLVVYHYYESIIPSIARVLNVTRVQSHVLERTKTTLPNEVLQFREKKLNEVKYQLNMHSIPFDLESIKYATVPDNFPAFPSINPGVIRMISSVKRMA